MGRKFQIEGGVRPKQAGHYPWPCRGDKDRTIELDTDDVLTKDQDGTYIVHTGLGCFGIVLTDEQIEPIGKTITLQFI